MESVALHGMGTSVPSIERKRHFLRGTILRGLRRECERWRNRDKHQEIERKDRKIEGKDKVKGEAWRKRKKRNDGWKWHDDVSLMGHNLKWIRHSILLLSSSISFFLYLLKEEERMNEDRENVLSCQNNIFREMWVTEEEFFFLFRKHFYHHYNSSFSLLDSFLSLLFLLSLSSAKMGRKKRERKKEIRERKERILWHYFSKAYSLLLSFCHKLPSL